MDAGKSFTGFRATGTSRSRKRIPGGRAIRRKYLKSGELEDPCWRRSDASGNDYLRMVSGFEFFEALGIVLELEVGNDFIEIRDGSRQLFIVDPR